MSFSVFYSQYEAELQLSWLNFVLTLSGDKMRSFFHGKIHVSYALFYINSMLLSTRKPKPMNKKKMLDTTSELIFVDGTIRF